MDAKAFDELKLRATIVPRQASWPPPEYVHWIKLHEAANEARERVARAFAAMEEIEGDPDLSKEGKERKRTKVAASALEEFQASNTLEKVRDAVARQMQQWEAKVGLNIKRAADIHEATVHAQIRDRLFGIKDRMSFVEQNGADPLIASAVLTAPQFLSGLSEAELKMLRHKIETHISPEIATARADTAKALQEAEVGWNRGQAIISQRGCLVKNADGIWSQPTDANAA